MSGLLGAMNTSLSGMQVETRRISVIAHNIANMNTNGFKAQRVVSMEGSPNGVSSTVTETGQDNPLTIMDNEIVELSNTDLATEIVNQRMAVAAFRTNISVIKTADEMLGATVNIRA